MKTLQELKREQYKHVASCGGYLEMREADSTNNNLNREQIKAFYREHGNAFLTNINFYDEKRQEVIKGSNIYTEYTGQKIYNFEYTVCIPCKDEELQKLISSWNAKCDLNVLKAIDKRIETLNGIRFVWF